MKGSPVRNKRAQNITLSRTKKKWTRIQNEFGVKNTAEIPGEKKIITNTIKALTVKIKAKTKNNSKIIESKRKEKRSEELFLKITDKRDPDKRCNYYILYLTSLLSQSTKFVTSQSPLGNFPDSSILLTPRRLPIRIKSLLLY